MNRAKMTQVGVWLAAAMALTVTGIVAAAPSKGPGGVSRVLHVKCGLYSPGSAPWQSAHDEAVTAAGYEYSVEGGSYRGPQRNGYCWFFNQRGKVTIRCPKGVAGTLYLFFLDLNDNHRRQTVTVGGRHRDVVEQFLQPAGAWREYKLSKQDTAAGSVAIEFVREAGANAVISRIDFVPAGMKDALAPEPDLLHVTTPKGMVEADWIRQEQLKRRPVGSRAAVADVLSRGEALLADLRELGAGEVADNFAKELQRCRARHDELVAKEKAGRQVASHWQKLYFDARWIVRQAAFANPLLDFDELLFVKRFTPSIGHQCSHHVGSAQQVGGDLCILKGLQPDGEVRSIIGGQLPAGAIGRPDLSFNADRIVFPYAPPRPKPTRYVTGQPGLVAGACLDYQLYEIGVDGKGLRQLTKGPSENTEPCYLPGGRICFTSSRCNKFVQCGDWAIVFSLYSMQLDGSDVRAITLAKEGEWWPSVLDDGRILYMRWEYVIKPFNTIQYLWTVRPDGTKATLAYGDHFAFSPGPLTFIEARQIPGTSKVITTGAAHHNSGVGPICIVDLARNRGDAAGLVRVTPEVGYPETSEMQGRASRPGWYNAPYPLSEKHYLACYSFEPAHNAPTGYGIYLMDVHGNKELIYRDRERSCYSPIPLRARKQPPALAAAESPVDQPATGEVLMLDVYKGLKDVPRGTIKHLRVLETISKKEHSTPQRLDVGIGSGWDPRRILGTVPVAEDGSAYFEAPADTAIFFEALDENYMDVRRMRSYMNVRPGERVTCVGCHESYNEAPPNHPTVAALRKSPAKITPPPWDAVPMDFRRIVQPVLDRHCVQCHDGTQGKHKSFDLTARHLVPAKGADNHVPPAREDPYRVTASFVNLLKYVSFTRLTGYEGGNLPLAPYAVGSHRSRLVKILDADHYGVKLPPADRRAIVAWIDCNAPYLGGWDDYPVTR